MAAKAIIKICELCEREFLVNDTKKGRGRRFCGNSCASMFKGNLKKITQTVTITCLECKKEITKRAMKGVEKIKYCSQTCATKAMGKNQKGKLKSEEHKKKIGLAHKGREFSEEHKKNIGKSSKGRIKSPEAREKLKKSLASYYETNTSWNKGLTKENNEIVKQISEKNTGYKASEETRRKLSEAGRGEKNGMFGKKHSDETKKRLSEAQTNYNKEFGFKVKFKLKSQSETLFFDTLEQIYNVKIKRQLWLKGRWFDGHVEKTNILIESDCPKWHDPETDKLKDDLAKDNGYVLFRFEINSKQEAKKKIELYKPILDIIFLPLQKCLN